MNSKEEFSEAIKNWMSASMHTFMRQLHIYAKQNSLSITQINTLLRIKKHGPIQVSDVSRSLDISRPAASQLMDKMVQRDFLKREESRDDRRVKFHNLTPNGEKLLKGFFESVKGIQAELVDSYSENEYGKYRDLLNSLTNNLLQNQEKDKKEE
ncbi:MarR family transcriptional regulator [Thiospirochaeta perfilievii]|uniref:MarR family transcriptional regulator n=1 Tax=Thiospirochaeta perfilievii TaxID=252967 RepID=A0A5C1Q9T7_9SPIO|nr:MarR family transcriptional regulator [Thiospirochaeta perfilievii]QEN03870.1 MarR family transcriptional regulator [Thiospirochaeta perfilievii]